MLLHLCYHGHNPDPFEPNVQISTIPIMQSHSIPFTSIRGLIYVAAFVSLPSCPPAIIPLAPSAIMLCCLSISICSCSAPNANAYGIPNNSTLVTTSHRPLQPYVKPVEVLRYTEEDMEESFERVVGGMMSRRA